MSEKVQLQRAFARFTDKGRGAFYGIYRSELTFPELLRGLSYLGARGELTPVGKTHDGILAYEVTPRVVKQVVDFLDGQGRCISRSRATEVLWRATKEVESIRKELPSLDLSVAEILLDGADQDLSDESREDCRSAWEGARASLVAAGQAELEAWGQKASELYESGDFAEVVADRIREAYEAGGFEGAAQLARIAGELKPQRVLATSGSGRGYERRR